MIEIDIILGSKYVPPRREDDLYVRRLSVNRRQICSCKSRNCQREHGMESDDQLQLDEGGENS